MGGTLNVTICVDNEQRAAAAVAARRTAQRVESWAARLTRFAETSDLCELNAATDGVASVRPTLAAALEWAQIAEQRSDGLVDVTLLDARLEAESGSRGQAHLGAAWRIEAAGRTAKVERAVPVRFDLDGVAKGWIADRAADLLIGWPSAAVDADGDICLRLGCGQEWLVDVADPRPGGTAAEPAPLATLRLRGGDSWSISHGVATSGTSIHRWRLADGRQTHHLIDPRTGRPAETDVVQATVVAPTAREAEMLAKSAVIVGSQAALDFLLRSSARTAILLLQSGELVALPGVEAWLA